MKRQSPYYIAKRAKELRDKMTPAEESLWHHLRQKKLDGFKFYRQYPVGKFIADFCCPSRKLIIELDGEIHEQHKEYDESRAKILLSFGFRIIRIKNEQILLDIESTLQEIKYCLSL